MTQPTIPGMEDLTEFAIDVICKAGGEALRYYGRANTEMKFDSELVTEAENHLIDFFTDQLHSRFPEHGIFGEEILKREYVHGEKGYLWIYDALDGVANFQAGVPIWGTSLALLENFWPVLGVFYMPVSGDLFHAQPGQKAYWKSKEIRIPDQGEISNESVLLTYSRFHNNFQSTFPGKIRNLGSTAAHICYVARGEAEGALLTNVSYQDLAAAQIILTAAGGKIFRMDGKDFHLGEYLHGHKIDEYLIAASPEAYKSIKMYLHERFE